MNEIDQERVIEVGSECSVTVESTSGDLTILGWDKPQVACSKSEKRVSVEQRGASVHLRPIKGSEDLTVMVPHLCDIAARTTSGDIELKEVRGRIDIQSMSGDATAEDVRGDLSAHTISGDISISGDQIEALNLGSVSGDIDVRAPLSQEGSYDLHTVSGDVHLWLPLAQQCTVDWRSIS
ncbi:MAG: DUF4097 family beta strand repeat protein, partial [Chloroflexi bacterium]|nr:DUF4097 family beta strand repeat protein [Chloroflexota bacterium]